MTKSTIKCYLVENILQKYNWCTHNYLMISKTTNFRNFHFSVTLNFSNQNDQYTDKNLLQTPTGYLKSWLFHYSKKPTLLHKCDICLQVFLSQISVVRNFWRHCEAVFKHSVILVWSIKVFEFLSYIIFWLAELSKFSHSRMPTCLWAFVN